MIEVLILALALSMDAFAVSIGLGSKHAKRMGSLALMAAIYFGLFQALMPLIGYFAGQTIFSWIDLYADWIAFALLVFIGVKMLYEAFSGNAEEDTSQLTHQLMLILAIATSIDAMAAGFTLTLFKVAPLLACAIIGVATFVFSGFGVLIGAKTGTWFEHKAGIIGGVVLVLMGFKMLMF